MLGDWCFCAKLPHAEVQQILVFFSLCFARNCYNEQVQGEELNQFHQEQWKLRDYVKSLRDQQIYLSVISCPNMNIRIFILLSASDVQ